MWYTEGRDHLGKMGFLQPWRWTENLDRRPSSGLLGFWQVSWILVGSPGTCGFTASGWFRHYRAPCSQGEAHSGWFGWLLTAGIVWCCVRAWEGGSLVVAWLGTFKCAHCIKLKLPWSPTWLASGGKSESFFSFSLTTSLMCICLCKLFLSEYPSLGTD